MVSTWSSVVTDISYDLCTYSVGKTIGSLAVDRVIERPPLGSQDSIQTQDQCQEFNFEFSLITRIRERILLCGA